MIYIFGGSGSGKSLFAENRILSLEKERAGQCSKIYVATMQVYGREDAKRVEKHRRQRAGKGFVSLECYGSLQSVQADKNSLVLLECMANFVANHQFTPGGSASGDADMAEKLWQEIVDLDARCAKLVIVGNDVFLNPEEEQKSFTEETRKYLDLMDTLHRRLSAFSEEVTELVFSLPIVHRQRRGCL